MKAAELERSTVKFFDNRDNKRFGFLLLESGEEVFFHLNDGQKVTVGVGEPCLEYGKIFRTPRVGDDILFKRVQGRQGPKACPWVFGDEFDRLAVESEKNTGKPMLTTTEEGIEYGCYKDGRAIFYKLGKSSCTALGVPCPSFEAPGYSHWGITSRVDLEQMLRYPIPEEMKRELRTRFEAYEKAAEERRPFLRELLRFVLGDVNVCFEDYERDLASLFEQDYAEPEEQEGWTPEELKEHFKRNYRERILERYWKPRTPKTLLHFYPGGCSGAGFLGWGEKLEDVIRDDEEILKRLGYTHADILRKLEEIQTNERQFFEQDEIFRKRNEKLALKGKEPRWPTKVERPDFTLESQYFLGGQSCPFEECKHHQSIAPGGCHNVRITNVRSGAKIDMPGMIRHLIEEHHFFEGKGSSYRVDPERLVKVIFG